MQAANPVPTHDFIEYLEQAGHVGDGARVKADIFVHNQHLACAGLGRPDVRVRAEQDVLQLRDLLVLVGGIFAALLATHTSGVVAFENLNAAMLVAA